MCTKLDQKNPILLMSIGVAGSLCVTANGGQWPYMVRWKCKGQFSSILQRRRRFWVVFQVDSLSNFSPKHIQTPPNTFDSSLFTIITRKCSCTRSSFPWFHTLDLRFTGVDVAFQLQPTTFSFHIFFLFNNMLYCFPQHVLASQYVSIYYQHVSLRMS